MLRKKHRPPHLFLDQYIYFFSLKTYRGLPVIKSFARKQSLFGILEYSTNKYDYELVAWVILDNHLHFMVEVANAKNIAKFINLISGKSAIEINKLDNIKGRKVWYQYWDHCIRNEKDYYMHLNYIHQNPVKHKLTNKIEDYQLSSYRLFIEKYGEKWIKDCFEQYPIVDFNPMWE